MLFLQCTLYVLDMRLYVPLHAIMFDREGSGNWEKSADSVFKFNIDFNIQLFFSFTTKKCKATEVRPITTMDESKI